MKSTRDPKNVVLEAELMASSAEYVRAWLEENARKKTSRLFGRDDGIDHALLKRGDPLILLSLARFSASADVVRTILNGPARSSKALRLTVLMNETVGKLSFRGIPAAFVEDRNIDGFLAVLDAEEVTALFSNAALDDGFLIDFFEQKVTWQALDDERRLLAIQALQNNSRMQAPYDGPYDGHAEYTHNRVFAAAWELAGKVLVTAEWAAYLCWLYEKLPPEAYSIKNPLELATRWMPDPADTERIESEKKSLEGGTLGVFAGMRKGIARLAVAHAYSQEERRALANHEDPAVRAAFYAGAPLTLEEIKAADQRDPLLSFEQMMWNPAVWRTKAHRKLLHHMAWDSKRDPKSYMDPQNIFEARLEYYRGAHSEWFKDEEADEEADASDFEVQAVTDTGLGSAIEGLQGELLTGNDLARATHLIVLKLLKRSAWLGWEIAAALALLLLLGAR